MGGSLSAGEDTVYVPARAFDADVLVPPSGRSLIAQLLTMANQLVIEDAELLPYHLERHFTQFALAWIPTGSSLANERRAKPSCDAGICRPFGSLA